MTKDKKIKELENRIIELENKKPYKLPLWEVGFLLLFCVLIYLNTFPTFFDIYLIYPAFMMYLFISGAIISLVAIIKGGYNNLKPYKNKGLIRGLVISLVCGLISILIIVLIIVLSSSLSSGLLDDLNVGVIGVLINGLIGGLIIVLIFGLSVGLIGVLVNGLVIGLICGLVLEFKKEMKK